MIVIVSGLPRSGTSLMMQMLQAGGMPLLIDDHRPADADNPNGYWEYEPVKRLQQDNSWVHQAEGKAVKVVSALLQYLPPPYTYKIIFMQRPMPEVLASQAVMLERRGAQGVKAELVGDAETYDGAVSALPRNDCRSCSNGEPCSAISRSAAGGGRDGPCRRSTPVQAAALGQDDTIPPLLPSPPPTRLPHGRES